MEKMIHYEEFEEKGILKKRIILSNGVSAKGLIVPVGQLEDVLEGGIWKG